MYTKEDAAKMYEKTRNYYNYSEQHFQDNR